MSYSLFVQVRWVDHGIHPAASPSGCLLCILLLAHDFCSPHASSNSFKAPDPSAETQHEHHLSRLHRPIHTAHWSGDRYAVRDTEDLAELATTVHRG